MTDEPNPRVAIVKNALFDKQQGKNDGYFMIMDWKGATTDSDAKSETPKSSIKNK